MRDGGREREPGLTSLVSVSPSRWQRSARKGPYALRPFSQQSPERCPRSKQSQYFSGWTQVVLDLGGKNVGRFLSPFHFSAGDQCCDPLACHVEVVKTIARLSEKRALQPTSQQHASVSHGPICSDNYTCCHTGTEMADQASDLTQSQYSDTGPTSPNIDPIKPGVCLGCHWSANFYVTGLTRPRKIPPQVGFELLIFRSRGGRLNHSTGSLMDCSVRKHRTTNHQKKKKKKKKERGWKNLASNHII